VRAFDIVGENLQLRLGVDERVLRQHEVAIGLLGVGFLRVLPDENFPVENAVRAAGQDAVIKLVAFATRLGVIDDGVMIDQLFAARQVKSVEDGFAALGVEQGLNLVAGQARAGGDGMREPMAVPACTACTAAM
jgi:hypothetical protein